MFPKYDHIEGNPRLALELLDQAHHISVEPARQNIIEAAEIIIGQETRSLDRMEQLRNDQLDAFKQAHQSMREKSS